MAAGRAGNEPRNLHPTREVDGLRAAVYYGRRDVRIEDVPEPQLRPGHVKVKVEWCGICGSDLHEYVAGPISIPTPGNPHPLTGETLPVVLGHEFAGTVVEVGEGVTHLQVGDRVAVEPILACGECVACRRGAYNRCAKLGFIGLSGGGGGLAEYVVVPAVRAHRVPEGMTAEQAALVEPLAVGFHAVRQAGFVAGQTAAVFGAGPVGLAVIQCLRAAGARQVIAVEVAAARKAMARELGADLVLDPTEGDAVEAIRSVTDGQGVHTAFDAAGAAVTLESAVAATAPGGTVVVVALFEQPVVLNPNLLLMKEITLTGSLAYADDFPAIIALMKDRIRAEAMVTGRIRLDEVVERGFEELVRHKDRHVKILVQP